MLRNLLDGLSTDSLLRRIFNAVNIPKDASGQPRVVASGTVSIGAAGNAMGYIAQQWGAQAAEPAYYGSGSPNSMDAREQQKSAQRALTKQVRATRWTIT